MASLETVKVKAETPTGHKLINLADYDENEHELVDDESREKVEAQKSKESEDENSPAAKVKTMAEEDAIRHGIQANRGQIEGNPDRPAGNASGTFDEPTPTDIRYPNKDATEFESNHGA